MSVANRVIKNTIWLYIKVGGSSIRIGLMEKANK